MVNLYQLPEEILLHIHVLSLSPFLPQVHPAIYRDLHHAPKSHIARYLIRLYAEYGPSEILVRSVRHRVCSVAVAEEIKRQWILPKRRPLTCSELPRRLFRTIDVAEPIHPLLDYLMNTYSPSPNSHKGYPLCRAVLTSNITLISYLLDHNANPAVHGALPVRLATQTGRLDLVKLLVESPPDTSPSKKFKRDDRIPIGPELVELAMKSGHEHIVQYFVHDKGVIPPLRSIMKLGGEVAKERPKRVERAIKNNPVTAPRPRLIRK